MLVFRDTAAIQGSPENVPYLQHRLGWLVREVTVHTSPDLQDCLTIVVCERGDTSDDLVAALGFELDDESPENVTHLPGWWELTFIVNGEGFGYVVYVPDLPESPSDLLEYCAAQSSPQDASCDRS